MPFGASHIMKQGLAPLTTKPIKTFKTIGVFVRWPGKKAEHSFFLDLLFLLHQVAVAQLTISGYLVISQSWNFFILVHARKKTIPGETISQFSAFGSCAGG